MEMIEQLESLKEHCQSMVDENDPECIWAADCEALAAAIETLRDVEFWKRDGRAKMKLKKEIKHLDEMLDSGVEWSNQKLKKAHINLRKWLKELREYRKLKKKGRLLEIPCAVGDTVYVKIQSGKYAEAEVRDFTYFLTCGFCVVVTSNEFGKRNISFSEFGKIVFLTLQEAEEALVQKEGRR